MGKDHWHGSRKGFVGGGGRNGGSGDPTVATGCMRSVFRFFDFQNFQLCYNLNHHQHHGIPEHLDSRCTTPKSLKGLEAPRNSSESEDASQSHSAPPFPKQLKENLTIPQMSVKTKRKPLKINTLVSSEEFSEDSFSSPGSRTPSLVARLMGLDLLPEAASPSFSASSTKLNSLPARKQMKNSGTQSLPDSPRTSLARWSDVDLHHRLSLQVNNKESNGEDHEVLCKRREMIKSLVQNSEAEGWSPGHYAKQIVKQVKEGVGRNRRVGLTDITNSPKGRATEQRRDEHLIPGPKIKIKTQSPPPLSTLSAKRSQKTTTSITYEENVENQPPIPSSNTHKHLPVSASTSSVTPTKQESTKPYSNKAKIANEKTSQNLKCRKAVEDQFKSNSRSTSPEAATFTFTFTSKSSSKNKKENEPLFIRPSPTANQLRNKSPLISKKTPLSTEHFSINPTTTTTTTTPRTSPDRMKQVISVSDKHKVNTEEQLQLKKQIISSEAKTQTVGVHEIKYVSKILKCMGIGNNTRLNTISNWFSPSHPLNPLIFDLLEPISSSNNLILKSNRQLIFQLTDEIMSDILSHVSIVEYMNGNQLVKLLISKMASFPLRDCRVMDDVDGLVGSDISRGGLRSEDENGSVVRELEREILDCLLLETTAFL